MPDNSLLCSVIIVTRNREGYLREALLDLNKQTINKDAFEVLVINDGSADSTAEMLKSVSGELGYRIRVFNQPRKGLTAARNSGIRNAAADIVAFHDDDVTADESWLANAVSYFEGRDIIGVEGKTVAAGRVRPFTRCTTNESGALYIGCNMFYRRAALNESGGFDVKIKYPFCDDYDMAWRVLSKGGKIIFAEDVIAYHKVIPIKGLDIVKRAKFSEIVPYLFKKHGLKMRGAAGFKAQRILSVVFLSIFLYSLLTLNFLGAASSLFGALYVSACINWHCLGTGNAPKRAYAFIFYTIADALAVFMFFYGCAKYRVMPNIKMLRR